LNLQSIGADLKRERDRLSRAIAELESGDSAKRWFVLYRVEPWCKSSFGSPVPASRCSSGSIASPRLPGSGRDIGRDYLDAKCGITFFPNNSICLRTSSLE
jgi:hypothetical protein